MRARFPLAGTNDGKSPLIAVVIVVVLMVSTVGVFLFATSTGSSSTVVQKGSNVKVDYIGKLPDGRVFDTSLYNVAIDNSTYPKSLQFSMRGNASTYTPLAFTVGGGAMIRGFDRNVTGMKVGETKTFDVTPADSYGNMDPKKLTTINLTEIVPIYKTISKADFQSYYNRVPSSGMLIQDPRYGWDVQVVFFDGNNALIQNLPTNNSVYKVYGSGSDSAYGWNVTATFDGSGNITVHNQLDASSALRVKGMDGSTPLFVESVDVAAGTAVLNENREVVGRTLTFTVTVVSIS